MFIPTWLLILIVVILVSVFLPGIWDALSGLASMLLVLLVIVSIPATLYFMSKNDPQTAWLVSLPWVAVAAWGVWCISVQNVRTSLWLHDMRVRSASKPEAVERQRRNLAEALDLRGKMWQFREDVKYFPSWYTTTNADGTPWTSNVVGKDEITEVHSSNDAHAAGLDLSALKVETPFVLYTFSAAGSDYAFCTCDGVRSFGFDHDADGEPLGACDVWVVEKPSRVVLSMRLAYYLGEYADTHSREGSYVEAFRPGPWLSTLLSIVSRVHQDERAKHERWRKQQERDRAVKNFS